MSKNDHLIQELKKLLDGFSTTNLNEPDPRAWRCINGWVEPDKYKILKRAQKKAFEFMNEITCKTQLYNHIFLTHAIMDENLMKKIEETIHKGEFKRYEEFNDIRNKYTYQLRTLRKQAI